MTIGLVIALTTFAAYALLTVIHPALARDLGVPYAAVMVTATLALSRMAR